MAPYGPTRLAAGARNECRKARHLKLAVAQKAKVGGAKRDRTADLLHAMQALSQLSYSPEPIERGVGTAADQA